MFDFTKIDKALIVSCYLEGMTGCEKAFIASIAKHPKVAGLRVEGIENIRFARQVIPDGKFIIGLKKRWSDGSIRNMITPNLEGFTEILHAGADMVATEDYLAMQYQFEMYGKTFRCPIMIDFSTESYTTFVASGYLAAHENIIDMSRVVFATTFQDNPGTGFAMTSHIRERFPNAIINCEGGLIDRVHIAKAFKAGANWVTVGKAINDPATIVNNLFPF